MRYSTLISRMFSSEHAVSRCSDSARYIEVAYICRRQLCWCRGSTTEYMNDFERDLEGQPIIIKYQSARVVSVKIVAHAYRDVYGCAHRLKPNRHADDSQICFFTWRPIGKLYDASLWISVIVCHYVTIHTTQYKLVVRQLQSNAHRPVCTICIRRYSLYRILASTGSQCNWRVTVTRLCDV